MPRPQEVLLRVVLDFICIFTVFLPWIVLNALNRPFQRGFFCDDESLAYPYKPSTVPTVWLAVIGVLLVAIIIIICESVHVYIRRRHYPDVDDSYYVGSHRIPRAVASCYKYISIFLFGCAAQQSFTEIGKFSLGRLRPHFFDGCRPDFSRLNCNDSAGHAVYVTDYTCTATDQTILNDIRLSFPSGHACLASYLGVFLTLYLQSRLSWSGSYLLRQFVSVIALLVALWICLTRISDYKHHWSDVLAGSLIGAVAAIMTAQLFKQRFLVHQPLFKSEENLTTTSQLSIVDDTHRKTETI